MSDLFLKDCNFFLGDFMALHFLAKPCTDYSCTKVWKQQRTIEKLHDVQCGQKVECHIYIFLILPMAFTLESSNA